MAKGAEEFIVAAVDIGTTKVCTVIAGVTESNEINVIGTGRSESTGVVKGAVTDISATSEAIRKSVEAAEKMADLKVDSVIVSISGKQFSGIRGTGRTSMSHSKHKEITEADMERAMEAAKSMPVSHDMEIIHVIPVQYIVDGQDEIKNPLGMTGTYLEVENYMVSGPVTSIENVKRVVERAGYRTEDVVLQSIASAESVVHKDEKEVGVMLIDIGGGTTDIAVYFKDALRFIKVIPVGGALITNDLVQGLQTPKAAAEEIKKKYGIIYKEDSPEEEMLEVPDMGSSKTKSISRRGLTEIIRPRVQELIRFIQLELNNNSIDRSSYQGGIVLTGGSSLLTGMDRLFEEEFGVRVRIGNPIREKVTGLADLVASPEYATSVGLIAYYMGAAGMNNNLLSQGTGPIDGFFNKIKKILSDFI